MVDVINNDAKQMRRNSYAARVLFLDKENRVWQVNLSYVIPGSTVAKTIAWKPEELKRYFSDISFRDGRFKLKSTGSHSESGPEQDVIKLSCAVNLDLPVKQEVQR